MMRLPSKNGLPLAAAAATFLSACSNLAGIGGSAEFKCKAPDGVQCQSVSGVYHNAQQGNLPALRGGLTPQSGSAAPSRMMQVANAVSRPDASAPADEPGGAAPGAAPPLGAIRAEPTLIRIWIAPWEDADGDLNDQSYVYLPVDSGRWLIGHTRNRVKDAFAPVKPPRAGAAQPAPAQDKPPASAQAPSEAAEQAVAELLAAPPRPGQPAQGGRP